MLIGDKHPIIYRVSSIQGDGGLFSIHSMSMFFSFFCKICIISYGGLPKAGTVPQTLGFPYQQLLILADSCAPHVWREHIIFQSYDIPILVASSKSSVLRIPNLSVWILDDVTICHQSSGLSVVIGCWPAARVRGTWPLRNDGWGPRSRLSCDVVEPACHACHVAKSCLSHRWSWVSQLRQSEKAIDMVDWQELFSLFFCPSLLCAICVG
jgi:hypothetical protein